MLTAFAMLVGLMAPAQMSKIEIEVSPGDAEIQVDGKTIAGTIAKVGAGRHTVRVSKDGYAPLSRTVTTKGGDTVKVRLNLRVAKTKGRKTITTSKRPTKPMGRPNTPKASPRGAKTPRKPVKRPSAKRPSKRPVKRPGVRKPAKDTMTPPVAKRPVTKRPVTKRPITKKPVTKKPRGKRPIGRRPVKKRPAGGVRPVDGGGGDTGVAGGTSPQGRTSTKPFAIIAFVVAGLAVTGGVIAGLAADGAAEDFNASTERAEKTKFKRDADNLALGSNIAYGVGATAAVLGVVLWAMDDTDDGYAFQAAPLPEGGAIVGLGGVF